MIALCIGNRKSLNEFNEFRIQRPQRHGSGGVALVANAIIHD
jgi:hypothetical protein